MSTHGVWRMWLPWWLALSGCVSGGFHSNQPLQQEYLLHGADATASAAAPATAPAANLDSSRSLEVLLPAAAPGLAAEGIAVLRPGERLDYYTGARWVTTAPQMLQSLAVEALRQQGRFALVESDSAPFAAGWVLQMELTHFEADYSGDGAPIVRVGLECTLGQRRAGRAVMTLTIETQARAQADRMQSVVAAFQSATSEALQQIAERLSLPADAPGAQAPAQSSPAGQPPPASPAP